MPERKENFDTLDTEVSPPSSSESRLASNGNAEVTLSKDVRGLKEGSNTIQSKSIMQVGMIGAADALKKEFAQKDTSQLITEKGLPQKSEKKLSDESEKSEKNNKLDKSPDYISDKAEKSPETTSPEKIKGEKSDTNKVTPSDKPTNVFTQKDEKVSTGDPQSKKLPH